MKFLLTTLALLVSTSAFAGQTITCSNNSAVFSGELNDMTLVVNDHAAQATLRGFGYGELLGLPGPGGEIIVRDLRANEGFTHHACYENKCTKYYLKVDVNGEQLVVTLVGHQPAGPVCFGDVQPDGSCLGRTENVPESYPVVGAVTFSGCR